VGRGQGPVVEAIVSLPVIFRPEAERDIAEAAGWYEGQRPGLGNEFLLGVGEATARIRSMPRSYAVAYRRLRACPVARFPYILYYRVRKDRLEVAAVVHGGRDPSVWKGRV
jgi:toxin ParE1/3/4